jgi:hypothetical protein
LGTPNPHIQTSKTRAARTSLRDNESLRVVLGTIASYMDDAAEAQDAAGVEAAEGYDSTPVEQWIDQQSNGSLRPAKPSPLAGY